jgi:hypothetical protein
MAKELRSDEAETKADKEFNEQLAGELLALGLVGEEVDLGQAGEDLAAADVVGFYVDKTEGLVVRSVDAESVEAKVTIVHELVHALQDQYFNLNKLYRQAKEGSESYALDFLVEGDATTVENAYLDTLSQAELDEYFGDLDDVADEPLPEGVPYVLDIFGYAPYALGESYVYALDPDGGTEGRDRAFKNPPKTEEVLLDPVALEQRQVEKKVPNPKAGKGEKQIYPAEQFGVITLYLLLATRLDPRTALEAVTGWGGDQYIGFKQKESGDACVRVNVTGDTSTDTDQFETALTAWQGEMPEGAVEVSRDDDVVTFTACENDAVTEPSIETFDHAFYDVLAGRVYNVLGVASEGVPLGGALCVGDLATTDERAIEIFAQAFEEDRDPTDTEFEELYGIYVEAADTCGVTLPF